MPYRSGLGQYRKSAWLFDERVGVAALHRSKQLKVRPCRPRGRHARPSGPGVRFQTGGVRFRTGRSKLLASALKYKLSFVAWRRADPYQGAQDPSAVRTRTAANRAFSDLSSRSANSQFSSWQRPACLRRDDRNLARAAAGAAPNLGRDQDQRTQLGTPSMRGMPTAHTSLHAVRP